MAHYHKISGFGHEVHSGPPSECSVCHPDRMSRDSIRVGHPTTDPGDGRVRHDACGQYVWMVLHSCKGVTVE